MSEAEEDRPMTRPSRAWARLAGVGVGIEALALAFGGLWALAVVVRGAAESIAVSLTLAAFALVLGALLMLASVALRRGRARTRGPVLTWQLIQAATAGTLIGGAQEATPLAARAGFWLAALLAVVVVVALVLDAARREG